MITAKAASSVTGPGAFDLGTYISLYNPYKAVRPPAGTWAGEPPGLIYLSEAKNSTEAYYMLLPSDAEVNDQLNWQFKSDTHFVARAVRVAYLYYRQSTSDDTTAVLIRDYALFGFEGGAAYGQSSI